MSREAACLALFNLISAAYPWGEASRRLKLWADVPKESRPAFFQSEHGPGAYQWTTLAFPKRNFPVKLFFYVDSSDPDNLGATQLNTIMDAVDAALAPAKSDLMLGRQTGGGTAFAFKTKSVLFRDPGDLDGDGVLIVEVEVILP